MSIIYCYDAYCVWSFGFSSVIKNVANKFSNIFDFNVLSGGMILQEKPAHINTTAKYFLETYPMVEDQTAVTFGTDYLWHINNSMESDWYPDSLKPAIALCILKEYWPEEQVNFATDLQFALYGEGRDLCDDEAYRHLLNKFNIPQKEFYDKLHDREYRQKAYDEFTIVKQLKITGFPTVLMQISESKFHLLTNGYTDYDTMVLRINNIIKQIDIQAS